MFLANSLARKVELAIVPSGLSKVKYRSGGRVAEGARLESV